MLFTIYQALPKRWVPSRNDKLIFEDIGYLYIVNLTFNGLWLIVFSFNTEKTFFISTLPMFLILYTCIMIMLASTKENVNVFEFICLRTSMSVYAGWVTIATVLNVSFIFKAYGWSDNNNMRWDEETWGIIILYVA